MCCIVDIVFSVMLFVVLRDTMLFGDVPVLFIIKLTLFVSNNTHCYIHVGLLISCCLWHVKSDSSA